MLVLSRRMWGEYAMGGWQGQLGRCLLGIYLIGLALSLYQPDPLVALPAGWGGVLGLLTTKAILSRSEEHTSELQSLMRISYAVFCLKKKIKMLNSIDIITTTN